MVGTRTFSLSSAACFSASEDNLGKRISPVASQQIILLVYIIVFHFLPLGYLLHPMVWFKSSSLWWCYKQNKPPHYWFWCSFPGASCFLLWPTQFLHWVETPDLPCSLTFLKCHCPLSIWLFIFEHLVFLIHSIWPWPSNNGIFIDPGIIQC